MVLRLRPPCFCRPVLVRDVRRMSVTCNELLSLYPTPTLSPAGPLLSSRPGSRRRWQRVSFNVESPPNRVAQEIDEPFSNSTTRRRLTADNQGSAQVRFKVDAIFKGKRSMFPSSGPLQDLFSGSLFDKQKAQIARWLEGERRRIAEAPEPLRRLEVWKTLSEYKAKLRELYGDAYIHREWETISKITHAKLLPRRS